MSSNPSLDENDCQGSEDNWSGDQCSGERIHDNGGGCNRNHDSAGTYRTDWRTNPDRRYTSLAMPCCDQLMAETNRLRLSTNDAGPPKQLSALGDELWRGCRRTGDGERKPWSHHANQAQTRKKSAGPKTGAPFSLTSAIARSEQERVCSRRHLLFRPDPHCWRPSNTRPLLCVRRNG